MIRRKYVAQPHYGTSRAPFSSTLGSYRVEDTSRYFGGQDKDLSLGNSMLSNNEKTMLAMGVIGMLGWFAFGPQIKRALKKKGK